MKNNFRGIEFIPNFIVNAHGSCLVKLGNTHVICTASIDEKIPHFLKKRGWLTAEYSMLPAATNERVTRDINKGGRLNGRASEIQRFIGRSLRSVLDFDKLGEKNIIIDCDVIQADGGTRTAAINGGYVALCLALKKHFKNLPITKQIAAISCCIINDQIIPDPNYQQDSNADVDSNIVWDSNGNLIEIQSSAEKVSFTKKHLIEFLNISQKICKIIMVAQKTVIYN
jgi:ribonuclease PH